MKLAPLPSLASVELVCLGKSPCRDHSDFESHTNMQHDRIMAAKALGAKRIVAVDLLDAKLQTAKSLGATDLINASEQKDIAAAIRAIIPEGVDAIMEATGVGKVIEQGIEALSHAGTMCLVGVPAPTPIQLDPVAFLLSCKTLRGVIEAGTDPVRVSRYIACLLLPHRYLLTDPAGTRNYTALPGRQISPR